MYSIESKMDSLVRQLQEKGWDIELSDLTTGLDFVPNSIEELTKEDVAEILLVIAHKDVTSEEDTVSISYKSIEEFYRIYKNIF